MSQSVTTGNTRRYRCGWFRLYVEMIDDPKVQLLPDRLFKLWINLLAITSARHGTIPSAKEIAYRLRLTCLTEVEDDIASLIQHGLLDWSEVDGKRVLQPHNWWSWQPPSGRSTNRVHKHRKKRKSEGETAVKRFSNADETTETYSSLVSTTVESIYTGVASQGWEIDSLTVGVTHEGTVGEVVS